MIFCLKARLLVGAVIPEQQKNKLKNQHGITIEKIDELLKLDPTPKGSWMPWIIKWDKSGELPPDIETLINKFERMKINWPSDDPRRNFGSLTPEQVEQVTRGDRHDRRRLSREELTRQLFDTGLPGAEVIVSDGPWKVWKVSNYKYLMILSGTDIADADATWTKWCTKQENYAKSYLANGNVYPIFYNDKPFAQAHFGASENYRGVNMPTVGTVLLDNTDHKFEIGPEMKMLVEFLRTHDKQLGGQAWTWIQNMIITLDKIPSDPDMLEYAKQLAMEEDYPRLKVMILKEHWWPEGFESLIDADNQIAIQTIMDNATPAVRKALSESDFNDELIFFATKGTADIFPAFAKAKQYTAFFDLPFEGNKIDLTTLGQLEKPTVAWILSLDQKGFYNVMGKLKENDPVVKVLTPVFWRKSMQPKGQFYSVKSNLANIMEKNYGEEYLTAKKHYLASRTLDMSELPENLEVGITVKRGPTYEGDSDLYPGNTGQIESKASYQYSVRWVGNPRSETVFYSNPREHLDVLPVEAKYLPSGAERLSWSQIRSLLVSPEEREKREKQPIFLPIGTKITYGPDSHQPGEEEGEVKQIAKLKGADGYQIRVRWENGYDDSFTYSPPTQLPIVSKEHWENPDAAHPEIEDVSLPKIEVGDLVTLGPDGEEVLGSSRQELVGECVELTISRNKDHVKVSWFDRSLGNSWYTYEPGEQKVTKLPMDKQFKVGCRVSNSYGQTGTLVNFSNRNNKTEGSISVSWDEGGTEFGWFFFELTMISATSDTTPPASVRAVSRYSGLRIGDAVQMGPSGDKKRWINKETGDLMIGKVLQVTDDQVTVELEDSPAAGGTEEQTDKIQNFTYDSNIREVQVIPGSRPVEPGQQTWPEIAAGDWVRRGPNWLEGDRSDLWLQNAQRVPRETEVADAIEVLGLVDGVEDDGSTILVKWGVSNDPQVTNADEVDASFRAYHYADGNRQVVLAVREGGDIVEDGGVTEMGPDPSPVIDELHYKDKLYITTPDGSVFHYSIQDSHLHNLDGQHNRALLTKVFADEYIQALEDAYGYPPLFGDWPAYNDGDMDAARRILKLLVEKGCSIVKEEE